MYEREASNNSFFSFLSCSGCSPNNPLPGTAKSTSAKVGINEYPPVMDDFESVLVRSDHQDINFLSDRSHWRQPSYQMMDSNYNSRSKNSMDSSLIKNVKASIGKEAPQL